MIYVTIYMIFLSVCDERGYEIVSFTKLAVLQNNLKIQINSSRSRKIYLIHLFLFKKPLNHLYIFSFKVVKTKTVNLTVNIYLLRYARPGSSSPERE